MGRYTFFPKAPSTKFVVRNIAPNNKTVRVFNTPIRNRSTYDLLSIPDISEADIRHSLLKGELWAKFTYRELFVVESDIDLLQFNDTHKAFLQSIGITKGLETTGGSTVTPFFLHQEVDLIGTKNSSNRVFTTPDAATFVRYNYTENPFTVDASPVIIHNILNEDGFKKKMFVQESLEDGSTINGIPTSLGADIINELLSVYPEYWGR